MNYIEKIKASISRIKAISKKEFKHLLRDYRMLAILLFFPMFLLLIFGYAINFDVRNIKIAVYDNEKSDLSREFIYGLTSSEYFMLEGYVDNDSQIKTILDDKIAQAVLVIPEDLSEKIYSGKDVQFQILIDGVDGNTALIIQNYINSAVINFNSKITSEILAVSGLKQNIPLKLEPRFWFNPDLQTTSFLIPGLIAMILVITAVVSVSLSLVREKEKGTIEQINVSSIKSAELLLGKTNPYVILALLNAVFILIAGYFFFDVVVKGSYFLLFITTLIFLFASTSIGILVSTISDSLQVAFSLSTFASLLPSVILSGFIFPIESMPFLIQIFTNITPAKFYIVILRDIILKGVGLEAFWEQIIYLVLFAVLMLGLANYLVIRKEKNA